MSFNVEKYVPTINSILRVSDLATISAKKIRNALAQEFPTDAVKENKGILDARILECFSAIRAEREDDDDEEPLEARKPPRPSQDLLKSDLVHPSSPLSSPKRKPVAPRDPRPAKKAKSEYTSDDDAKFAAELDQALNATPVRKTRGGGGATRAKPKSRVRTQDEDKKEKKKRAANPNNAFNAPQLLSPQLAAVVGVTELPRPTVVKKLWEYIKANGLQNPLHKTEIICDDMLRPIFNVDKIHMFTMNKILSNHIYAKDDVVGGAATKKSTPTASQTSIHSSPPKRNGKHVLSDARVRSEESDVEEDEPPSQDKDSVNESDISRFSDSEEDS